MRLTHAKLLLLGNQGSGPAPFSDDFNRADGALGNGWTGATWAISGNKAVNTPTLGANVVVNGTFDADTDWTKGVDWSIADGKAKKAAPGVYAPLTQSGILTVGTWYNITFTYTASGKSLPWVPVVLISAGTANKAAIATGVDLSFWGNIGPAAELDDVVVQPLSGMFAYRDVGGADGSASAKLTRSTSTGIMHPAGVGIYVDDNNYVIAFLSDSLDSRLYLFKSVSGTKTALANVAVTYGAGKALQLTRSGNDFSVAYDGSTLINATAINDAVFAGATQWGMFSTGTTSTLEDFAWQP